MEYVKISLRIRKDLYDALRFAAYENHCSQRQLIEEALELLFEGEDDTSDIDG